MRKSPKFCSLDLTDFFNFRFSLLSNFWCHSRWVISFHSFFHVSFEMIEMPKIIHLNIWQLFSLTHVSQHYATSRKVSTVIIIIISFSFAVGTGKFHSHGTNSSSCKRTINSHEIFSLSFVSLFSSVISLCRFLWTFHAQRVLMMEKVDVYICGSSVCTFHFRVSR